MKTIFTAVVNDFELHKRNENGRVLNLGGGSELD